AGFRETLSPAFRIGSPRYRGASRCPRGTRRPLVALVSGSPSRRWRRTNASARVRQFPRGRIARGRRHGIRTRRLRASRPELHGRQRRDALLAQTPPRASRIDRRAHSDSSFLILNCYFLLLIFFSLPTSFLC